MPFAGLFAPEKLRLVKNMIRRKRWLSVLCAMAVVLASVGGWWSEYQVGAAATYWAYVEDYYQGSLYNTYSTSYNSNSPVTVSSFFQSGGTDTRPGAIYSGMVLTSYSTGSVIPLEAGTGNATLSRYFGKADCKVTYTDKVTKGPRRGEILGSTEKIVPCGDSIGGRDIDKTYTGFVYAGDSDDDTCKYTASIERKFEPVTTTVYYNYQGAAGGSVTSEEFYYGSAIRLARNTSVKKYTVKLHSAAQQGSSVTKTIDAACTFRGWSEQAGGNPVYGDGVSLGTVSGSKHSSKSLFAVWANGTVTLPAPEARKGYKFLGWSTNPKAATGSTSLTVAANTDVYPIWAAEEKSWKAEYYKEKLDGEYELVNTETHKGLVDNAASLSAPGNKYQGFSLNTAKSKLSGTIPAQGDLVLKAYYSRNSYSVVYDANGGEKTGNDSWSSQKKFGDTVRLLSPNVKRTGYRFQGWCQRPEGGENILAAGSDFTVPAQNVTLYASWEPIRYEVAFKGNGAANEGEDMENIQGEYDGEVTLPECTYTKPGYGFAGWNTKADGSGLMYGAGATVRNLTASQGTVVTLYAQWKIKTYHVSYHTNHTEQMLISNANAIPDTEFKYGEEVTARNGVYKALGYQMTGWNTKADGTGIAVALGEKISDKIECNTDIVLYAVWDRNKDTAFEVVLSATSADNKEIQLGKLTLSGVTEEKICDAIKRIYEEELDGEPLSFFYEGYEVVNMEEMEKTIAGDGSTAVHLQLKERRCQLFFRYFADGQEAELGKVDLAYMEPYVLPEKVGEQAGAARYTTAKQESYSPGEEIRLRRNKVLYLQQAIRLEGDSGQFEDRTEYVIRGKNFALPEITKNGYRFLGWYIQNKEYIGTPGQVMQRVMVDHTLTARWSEPLHYEIRFDIDEDKVRILENKVLEYQYGTAVDLPTKEQVAVLVDGYVFLGWYEDGDESKTLVTSVTAGSFGDKRFKALLVKGTEGGQGGNGSGGNGDNGSGGNGGNGSGGNGGNGSGGNGGNGSGGNGGNGSGGNGDNGSGGNGGNGSGGNGGNGSDGNGGQGGNGSGGSGGNGSGGNGGQGGNGSGGSGGSGGNGSGGNGGQGGNGSGGNGGQNGADGSGGNGGQNGADGSNGSNGQNGANGSNGSGGQNGANGSNGSNGQDGANGNNGSGGNGGQNGTNGSNGSNGQNGTNGSNGQDGANGSNGSNGQDGANGSNGSNGQNGANGSGGSGGNGGQNGTNGSDGSGGQNGANGSGGADGGLEEKPNAGNSLDSMKQQGIQDSNSKLVKFWKNKLRYQMRRGEEVQGDPRRKKGIL